MNRDMVSAAAKFLRVLVVVTAAFQVTSAGTVSFLDETFVDTDWSMQVLEENFISQNFTAAQQMMGGMPGEYRRNFMFGDETTNNGGIGPAGATVGHFWDVDWNPATQGAVDGVMIRMDGVAFDDRPAGQTVPTGVIVGMSFLLRQAGVVYVRSPTVINTSPDGVWRQLTYNATQATLFTRYDGQPGHPDFSSAGARIEFGYYTRAGAFVPAISNFFGVDNFQVTIETPGPIIPEPVGLALISIGMLALSGKR